MLLYPPEVMLPHPQGPADATQGSLLARSFPSFLLGCWQERAGMPAQPHPMPVPAPRAGSQQHQPDPGRMPAEQRADPSPGSCRNPRTTEGTPSPKGLWGAVRNPRGSIAPLCSRAWGELHESGTG